MFHSYWILKIHNIRKQFRSYWLEKMIMLCDLLNSYSKNILFNFNWVYNYFRVAEIIFKKLLKKSNATKAY